METERKKEEANASTPNKPKLRRGWELNPFSLLPDSS